MASATDDFIRQGLRHYPDADAATREFRRLIAEKITARVKKRAWIAWRPQNIEFSSTSGRAHGNWVGAGGPGQIEGTELTASVDVGVVWNSSDLDVPRAFCVYVSEGPDWLRRSPVLPDGLGVECRRSYLFISDDSESPDVDDIFDRLLAAFDACVAAFRTAATR